MSISVGDVLGFSFGGHELWCHPGGILIRILQANLGGRCRMVFLCYDIFYFTK